VLEGSAGLRLDEPRERCTSALTRTARSIRSASDSDARDVASRARVDARIDAGVDVVLASITIADRGIRRSGRRRASAAEPRPARGTRHPRSSVSRGAPRSAGARLARVRRQVSDRRFRRSVSRHRSQTWDVEDGMNADDSQVLKKVYFIKRAREGEELVTLLKNKFKTIDAIRDVLGWYREGREFAIDLRGLEQADDEAEVEAPADAHLRFVVSRWTAPQENNRAVLGAIGHILSWLDAERPFDIALVPRQRFDGPGALN
jgi:hypothetical protein